MQRRIVGHCNQQPWLEVSVCPPHPRVPGTIQLLCAWPSLLTPRRAQGDVNQQLLGLSKICSANKTVKERLLKCRMRAGFNTHWADCVGCHKDDVGLLVAQGPCNSLHLV